MNPFLKFKKWYETKLLLYRIKRDLPKIARRKFPIPLPLTKRILSCLWSFWIKHWPSLIAYIIMIIGIGVTLFVHYYK